MTRQNKKVKVRNENRPGYKKTRIGWIPKDWEYSLLGNFINLISGQHIKAEDYNSEKRGVPYITGPNDYCGEKICATKYTEAPKTVCKQGDILVTCKGSGAGSLVIADKPYCISRQIMAVRSLSIYHPFSYIILQKNSSLFKETANGLIPGISRNDIQSIAFALPTKSEQNKISATLLTWDEAIKQTQSLIDSKTRLKKWLMQKLLTGQLRVTGSQSSQVFIKTKIGLLPEDWKVKPFTELFQRISEPVRVKQDKEYREIGIRSHGKGIFHKDPVTGSQLGNKRVFHVQPGTLVFNIVFAWEQAVGILSEKERGFIASHRFPMFRADQTEYLEAFALLFFLSKRGKHGLGIASPGGAGRNKTLGQQELNHLYLPVPPIQEQKKIIHILNLCETEITQLTKQKNALVRQKKGLMQKLLTGEIRV